MRKGAVQHLRPIIARGIHGEKQTHFSAYGLREIALDEEGRHEAAIHIDTLAAPASSIFRAAARALKPSAFQPLILLLSHVERSMGLSLTGIHPVSL